MLQKIVSLTLGHSLTDLAWGRRRIEVESNLRGLEIKDQMVGVECLDVNTSVARWFSLIKLIWELVVSPWLLSTRVGGGWQYI